MPAGSFASEATKRLAALRPPPVVHATGQGAVGPSARESLDKAADAQPRDPDTFIEPLNYFRGTWDVEGKGWSGEMRVTRPMTGWQQTDLLLRSDAGQTRRVSMREGYDPFAEQFVRRKEADSGCWFDYESVGWTGPSADTLTWEGIGYNFYGRAHGRVRSVCTKVDEHTFRHTDYVRDAQGWKETYTLSYHRRQQERDAAQWLF